MRSIGLLLAFVVLVAGWGVGTSSRASLRLWSTSPLTIRGLHFKAGERVRLAVRSDGSRAVRRVRASAAGSFTRAGFSSVDYDPCSTALVVSAVGSNGSRVSLKVPQRECPPKP